MKAKDEIECNLCGKTIDIQLDGYVLSGKEDKEENVVCEKCYGGGRVFCSSGFHPSEGGKQKTLPLLLKLKS